MVRKNLIFLVICFGVGFIFTRISWIFKVFFVALVFKKKLDYGDFDWFIL